MRLRDQTSLAARKVQKRQSDAVTSSTDGSESASGDENGQLISPVLSLSLSKSPEFLSVSYFMNVYAPTSAFNYLIDVSPAFLTQKGLEHAFLAPALLFFSQNWRDSLARSLAQKHYALALRSINLALSNPDSATADRTLLSVLLLSLFEALIFQGRSDPINWNAHTQGAMELLRLRGKQQFNGPLGRSLFRHASMNIRTQCAQLGLQAPSALAVLETGQFEEPSPREHQYRLFGQVVAGIASLRCERPQLTTSEVILRIFKLEADIHQILIEFQKAMPFHTLDPTTLHKSIRSFRGRIDHYPSFGGARDMNTLRMVRLFIIRMLDETLVRRSVQPGAVPQDLFARARTLIDLTSFEMIADILSSVPYILDIYDQPNFSARSLIYCLSGVAILRFTPLDAREYAVERLTFVGERYGFPQAIDSAKMVLQGKDLEKW